MDPNKLFSRTRWRLASWYAGVMGIILGLCGLGVYEAIVHAHQTTLDRELEAVAGTLHDSIEPVPQRPDLLEQRVQQLSSEVCLTHSNCHTQTVTQEKRHVLGALYQDDYYLRLLDRSGQTVAKAGLQPQGLSLTSAAERWKTIQDPAGTRYHQISLPLHAQDNRLWGSLQVGRSLSDVDSYLAGVRLSLFLGVPLALLLISGSSWWLAGLAMQPISRSYQQMQQFTADAAHELRTPLAATQATIESALRINRWSDEGRAILKTIERQNNRLAQLVKDLLLLSHTEQQAISGKYQACCLNNIVDDLVEELAPLALTAQLMLSAKVPPVQQPLYVLGDEEQLYRLVSNLIVNAIHYTPAGGQVTVVLDRSDHQAFIHILDTGIGIAPAEQTRIFDRFYRVHRDRSRQTGGAGLGLPIAQLIAQTHHGSIQVHSQLGQGSTF
ncbi:MAG TPA: two-component system sensor histidine kinase RppB, partial [Candidatus Caenarcaniphilales bacterium]